MNTYSVNLDRNPSERWKHVVWDMRDAMQDLPEAYDQALNNELGCFSFLEKLADMIVIPDEFHEEIKAIAHMSGTEERVLIGLVIYWLRFSDGLFVCGSFGRI